MSKTNTLARGLVALGYVETPHRAKRHRYFVSPEATPPHVWLGKGAGLRYASTGTFTGSASAQKTDFYYRVMDAGERSK